MLLKRVAPIHGWRSFVGEVVIVVLGVGIALIAQQWVENRSWRARVVKAERQLTDESRDNFFYGAERAAARPCIDAQLDRLIAVAMRPGDRLAPQPSVTSALGTYAIRQPSRPFDTTAWTSIVGDGVAAHFNEDRRNLFSAAYNQIDDLDPRGEENQVLAASLSAFLFPIAVDANIRERLIERAMSLKANNNLFALKSVQMMSTLDALGAAPSKESIDRRFADNHSRTIKFCRERGLPIANWHQEMTKERAASIEEGDMIGRYIKARR